MHFFPIQRRSLNLNYSAEKAEAIIRSYTLDTRSEMYEGEDLTDKRFIGVVKDKGFNLSMRSKHMQHFLPIMQGIIEEVPGGAVILLRYKICGQSFFFVGLSMFIGALVGGALLAAGDFYHASMVIAAVIVAYFISVANFKQQVRLSHDLLKGALGAE